MSSVRLDSIAKRFGQTEAVRGVSLDIADGEFVVFVGPSGCGKTTTLNIIAGLESPPPATSTSARTGSRTGSRATATWVWSSRAWPSFPT